MTIGTLARAPPQHSSGNLGRLTGPAGNQANSKRREEAR